MRLFDNELHVKDARFDTIWSPVCFLETQDVASLMTAVLCNDISLSRGETVYIDRDDFEG